MLPALTDSPPKHLTPNIFGLESRPLRVLPPAFLCAIVLLLACCYRSFLLNGSFFDGLLFYSSRFFSYRDLRRGALRLFFCGCCHRSFHAGFSDACDRHLRVILAMTLTLHVMFTTAELDNFHLVMPPMLQRLSIHLDPYQIRGANLDILAIDNQ